MILFLPVLLLIYLVPCLAFATLASVFAQRKHRHPTIWFIAGGFLWLIPLVVLAFLPYRCESDRHDVTNAQARQGVCPACDAGEADWSSRNSDATLAN